VDGTVDIPDHLISERPCQWVDEELDYVKYVGRWRGWLERSEVSYDWSDIAPSEYKDIPAIEPDDPNCQWHD
jgi:hypothetical protein